MSSPQEESSIFDSLDVEVVTIMRTHHEDGTSTLDVNHDGLDDDVAMAMVARAMVALGHLDDEDDDEDEDDE